MNLKEKIRVFISSKCGNEKGRYEYELIREALKQRLEDTGFISAYAFESTVGSSKTAMDSFMDKLDDADLVLFLIDNVDSPFPEGVMKEYLRAKELNKKAIYLFFNIPENEKTSIEKSLYGANGSKFHIVNSLKEFIQEGYKSVIEDIFTIYKDYCRGRLHNNNSPESIDIVKADTFINGMGNYIIPKTTINNFSEVINFFKALNRYHNNEECSEVSNTEALFIEFAKLVLCDQKLNENNFKMLKSSIVDMHDDRTKEVIRLKWEAIEYCYSNNLTEALKTLNNLYAKSINEQIEEWIINDILIDIRNLEIINKRDNNLISVSEAQKALNSKEDILYYPILDRLSQNIYLRITKERNKADKKTPYTTFIGTGIESILTAIGEYFIWAVYYGSYTHIKIVRTLLQDVFLNFYEVYKVSDWGFLALKYSLINNDTKTIKYICDSNSNIISSCSKDKLSKLYDMSNYIDIKSSSIKLKLAIYQLLGYYFSEEKYLNIQKEIFNIINEWVYSSNSSVDLGKRIFTAIQHNIERISMSETLRFLTVVLDKKYYRFYDSVFHIISMISQIKIKDEYIEGIIEHIVEIIKDSNARNNYKYLKSCISNLRRLPTKFEKTLDDVIATNWEEFNRKYKLEFCAESSYYYETIEEYIREIEKRNLIQGKSGYIGYSYYPAEVIINILLNSKDSILDDELLKKLTIECKSCLHNEKQLISEKISCLRLLIKLRQLTSIYKITFDWHNYYCSLMEQEIVAGESDEIFEQDTFLTLRFYILIFKFINNERSEIDLLTLLMDYTEFNESYENIKLIEGIIYYLDIIDEQISSNAIDTKIYFILFYSIINLMNDSWYETRYKLTNCLFKFIGKINDEIIFKYINILSNDKDYRVKIALLRNINHQSKENIIKLKYIIEKYCTDNNYLVSQLANQIYKTHTV